MEDLETSQAVIEESQPFSLLDVSNSDDDFLLASSSEACPLLDTKANAVDNQGDAIQGEQIKQSNPIELQRPKKSGKCNLRKSLAWDSAFFTSAGVLEPDELSSIMEEATVSVKKKPFLPGIQEDVSKSTDSISTFESDLTLESIEADLFSDIRASIQRCSKSSTLENSKDSTIHDGRSFKGSSTKVAETSSGNTAKSKLPSKKLHSVVQPSLKSLKPSSVCKQVPKPAIRRDESSSSLPRRPDAAGKPSLRGSVTIKRMPVSAGRVKSESNTVPNLKVGKAAPLQNTAPKKVATIRSSRSSCDSSSSTSSNLIRNSLKDVGMKMEKSSNVPFGSKTRVPSRVAVKNKPQSGNSNLSNNNLKSTTKPSPSISPASSISEWSVESCSSTITVEQKNISLKPGSYSSKDHNVNKSVSQNPEGGSNYDESLSQKSSLSTSTETMVTHSNPGFAKPSGLRMPSAKIGFFDGVKASTKTPTAVPRSRSTVPSSVTRSTVRISTPTGSVNKTKLGNTSAKVTPITARHAKPEPIKISTNIKRDVHIDVYSPNLVVGENEKVDLVGEGNLVAEPVSFAVGDGFNIIDSADQPKNICVSPSSRADQSKKCDIVSDGDQSKVVNLKVCEDACAGNRVDGQVKCMEAVDCKMEMSKPEDCDSEFQNVLSNENDVGTIHPLKLFRDEGNQTRTPFSVKNSRFGTMENCAPSSDSAVDTLMMVDVLPCQHEALKENV